MKLTIADAEGNIIIDQGISSGVASHLLSDLDPLLNSTTPTPTHGGAEAEWEAGRLATALYTVLKLRAAGRPISEAGATGPIEEVS